jgi:hypothetical protein
MSNYLTIATVTEVLRQLAQASARDAGFAGAEALVLRPPIALTAGHPPGHANAFVGIYPYQITPNAQWRNTDIPTRRSDGSMMQAIRSAYNLDFLLTCYGDDSQLEPQVVLGALLRRLAAEPIVNKAMIKDATYGVLAANNLDTEIEQVKLSLLPLNLEEFSKLWSVFFQTTYDISVAVQASVLFIDGVQTPGPSLPVYQRNVYVLPIVQPEVDQVLSQKTLTDPPQASQPILFGDVLVLSGRQLRGEVTKIRIVDLEVDPTDVSESQVRVILEEPPFPTDSLRAGIAGVQIVQPVNMGTPASVHKGFESNIAVFVLRPSVTPGPVVILTTKVIDLVTYRDATVTLNFVPKLGLDQRLVLLLNEFNPPPDRAPRTYRFEIKNPPPPPDPVDHIDALVTMVAAGDYLVRVQVDGAESLLDPGPDQNAPKFIGPLVTI